jgi:hypothetical protein
MFHGRALRLHGFDEAVQAHELVGERSTEAITQSHGLRVKFMSPGGSQSTFLLCLRGRHTMLGDEEVVLGFGGGTHFHGPPNEFLFRLFLAHACSRVRVGNSSFRLAMGVLDDPLGHRLRLAYNEVSSALGEHERAFDRFVVLTAEPRFSSLGAYVQSMNSILELLYPNGDSIDKFVDVGGVVPAPTLTKLSVSQYFDRKFHGTLCWTSRSNFLRVNRTTDVRSGKTLSAEQTPLL